MTASSNQEADSSINARNGASASSVAMYNGFNVSLDATTWDDYRASDVFIIPTVTTGEGVNYLVELLSHFVSQDRHYLDQVLKRVRFFDNDVKFLRGAKRILLQTPSSADTDTKYQHYENILAVVEYYDGAHQACAREIQDHYDSLRLMGRLCAQLQKLQIEHADELLRDPTQIARLSVAIRCIDSTWSVLRQQLITVTGSKSIIEGTPSFDIEGKLPVRLHNRLAWWIRDVENGPRFVFAGREASTTLTADADGGVTPEVGGEAHADGDGTEMETEHPSTRRDLVSGDNLTFIGTNNSKDLQAFDDENSS